MLEVLITLAILGTLLAMALPIWSSLIPGYQLNSATRQVATELQLARNRAMAQYRRFRVVFQSATSYRVERETSPDAKVYTLFSGPKSLPSGVTITANSTPIFQTRGNASPGATITLTNSLGASKQITVLVSGRIEVK